MLKRETRFRQYRGPRKFVICGESGGIGRPNNDVVVGQCDPIAERERQVSSVKSMRFVLCKVVYSLLSL